MGRTEPRPFDWRKLWPSRHKCQQNTNIWWVCHGACFRSWEYTHIVEKSPFLRKRIWYTFSMRCGLCGKFFNVELCIQLGSANIEILIHLPILNLKYAYRTIQFEWYTKALHIRVCQYSELLIEQFLYFLEDGWMSWKRKGQNQPIEIVFKFDSPRTFRKVNIFTANLIHLGIQVCIFTHFKLMRFCYIAQHANC